MAAPTPPVGDTPDSVVEPVETPLLRIITPGATPEEIAALVAVLSAIGAGTDTPSAARKPEWQAHHRKVRNPAPHASPGWRSSGLPR